MLSKERAFVAEYEARLVDSPSGGEVDFTFTDGRGGARVTTVSVDPLSGPSWIGSFAAAEPSVRRAVSGLFGTPSPIRLCVVERGTAFLVDVLTPVDWAIVPTDGPVVGVEQLVDESRLLLLTPWSITAVDVDGVAWTSPRIAIEGLRVDEVDGGWLRGVADPDDDEPRDFAVDLRTGHVEGGGGIS